MSMSVREAGTLPPLEADEPGVGASSDHRIAYVKAALQKVPAFTWLTYSDRYFNQDSVQLFKRWVTPEDWRGVLRAEGSQNKAVIYQGMVTEALERCFLLITVRRKSTDAP